MSGWSNPNGSWHIGLATSPDGINWQKYPCLYFMEEQMVGRPELQAYISS